MNSIEKLYQALQDDFGFEGATDSIKFNLNDYQITVEPMPKL